MYNSMFCDGEFDQQDSFGYVKENESSPKQKPVDPAPVAAPKQKPAKIPFDQWMKDNVSCRDLGHHAYGRRCGWPEDKGWRIVEALGDANRVAERDHFVRYCENVLFYIERKYPEKKLSLMEVMKIVKDILLSE